MNTNEIIEKLTKDLNKIPNLKVKMAPKWSGSLLTTVFEVDGSKYKSSLRLSNGGSARDVYILGTTGWNHYLSTDEIGFRSKEFSSVSYTADIEIRCAYCAEATYALISQVSKINE